MGIFSKKKNTATAQEADVVTSPQPTDINRVPTAREFMSFSDDELDDKSRVSRYSLEDDNGSEEQDDKYSKSGIESLWSKSMESNPPQWQDENEKGGKVSVQDDGHERSLSPNTKGIDSRSPVSKKESRSKDQSAGASKGSENISPAAKPSSKPSSNRKRSKGYGLIRCFKPTDTNDLLFDAEDSQKQTQSSDKQKIMATSPNSSTYDIPHAESSVNNKKPYDFGRKVSTAASIDVSLSEVDGKMDVKMIESEVHESDDVKYEAKEEIEFSEAHNMSMSENQSESFELIEAVETVYEEESDDESEVEEPTVPNPPAALVSNNRFKRSTTNDSNTSTMKKILASKKTETPKVTKQSLNSGLAAGAAVSAGSAMTQSRKSPVRGFLSKKSETPNSSSTRQSSKSGQSEKAVQSKNKAGSQDKKQGKSKRASRWTARKGGKATTAKTNTSTEPSQKSPLTVSSDKIPPSKPSEETPTPISSSGETPTSNSSSRETSTNDIDSRALSLTENQPVSTSPQTSTDTRSQTENKQAPTEVVERLEAMVLTLTSELKTLANDKKTLMAELNKTSQEAPARAADAKQMQNNTTSRSPQSEVSATNGSAKYSNTAETKGKEPNGDVTDNRAATVAVGTAVAAAAAVAATAAASPKSSKTGKSGDSNKKSRSSVLKKSIDDATRGESSEENSSKKQKKKPFAFFSRKKKITKTASADEKKPEPEPSTKKESEEVPKLKPTLSDEQSAESQSSSVSRLSSKERRTMYSQSLMSSESGDDEPDCRSPVSVETAERVKKTFTRELDEFPNSVSHGYNENEPDLVNCLKFYYCGTAAKYADTAHQKACESDKITDDDDMMMTPMSNFTEDDIVHHRGIPVSPKTAVEIVLDEAEADEERDDGIEERNSMESLDEAPDILPAELSRTASFVRDVTDFHLTLDGDQDLRAEYNTMEKKRNKDSSSNKDDGSISISSIVVPDSRDSVADTLASPVDSDASTLVQKNIQPKEKTPEEKKAKKTKKRDVLARFRKPAAAVAVE